MPLSSNTQQLLSRFDPYQCSEADKQKIDSVISAVRGWGTYLGLDLNNKLPTSDTVFFFDAEQFHGICKTEKFSDKCEGFARAYFKEAIVKISGSSLERKELRSLCHELVHIVTPFKYELRDGMVNYLQNGYLLADQSFQAVDEAVTELSAYQIYINFWKKYPQLKIYTDRTASNSQLTYVPECYLVLLILDLIAAQTGKPFSEMLRIMQKSLLTNYQDGLDFLAKHMDPNKYELLKNIKEMDTFESDDLLKQKLTEFGLFDDLLKHYNNIDFCIWDKLVIPTI